MKLRYPYLLGLLLAAAAVAGCDQGRKALPKTTVTIANAAPSYAQLGFRREQDYNNQSTLAFRGTTSATYDEDTYDFYVDPPRLQGAPALDPFTFAQSVRGDMRYTFVLGEAAGSFMPFVLEYPPPPSGEAQFLGLHAADGVPAVDVYLTAPGAGIAGATPIASPGFGEQIAPQSLAAGDYELTLTAVSDPSTVLLLSGSFTLTAGTSHVLVVVPEAGESTRALSVLLLYGTEGSQVLYDRNAPSAVRIINGAADEQPRDVAVNGEFMPPLFSSVPFAEPTSFVETPASTAEALNVTPPGNPGVLELDKTIALAGGFYYTILFAGETGAVTHAMATESRRSLVDEATVRFYSVATQFATSTEIVFIVRDSGNDPTTATASASVSAPSLSQVLPFPPGDYDIYLRETGTTTLRAGPIPVTLAGGGLYGVLATNGPDTATADVVLFDDFP
jgi:hypothetical protein